MARPQNKTELIESADTTYDRLLEAISKMTKQECEEPFDFSMDVTKKERHWKRDKNVRDVLIHLHEWHKLVLNWIGNKTNETKRPFLKEGYNWKTYGEMNALFWEKGQDVSYEDALAQFKISHQKMMEAIESLSEEELFSKGMYDWVGGSTIGSYFTSSTSSHYEWAIKKIKAHKKNIKNKQ
ncbi:MAG: ClbS/DfsB family four-helix bundle protein [Alkalibacterium sp.]|nr:ClbS/DfsB family four-helix bundle protein [Alkalibacterium sp.]